MTAGLGVQHSEFNQSEADELHLLQIRDVDTLRIRAQTEADFLLFDMV